VASSRFLANFPAPVFITQRGVGQLPSDISRMMTASSSSSSSASFCPEAFTGRMLLAPDTAAEQGVPMIMMDISLCNIIGMAADYVYIPSRNSLYVLFDPVGDIVLLLMSLLVIYLMVIMGHNLQVVLGAAAVVSTSEESKPTKGRKGQWTVVCMLVLVAMTCFASSSWSVLNPYVTWEDRLAFFALLAHVIYYCARIELNAWLDPESRRANPVNPMLAAITLAVQRVYGSAENPYSTVLFFIMITWALHKVSMLGHRFQCLFGTGQARHSIMFWRSMDVLADACMLSVLLYAGVLGQMQMESTTAAASLLQGILAAMTLNRAITPLHFASCCKK
jgi:hypothetical protein